MFSFKKAAVALAATAAVIAAGAGIASAAATPHIAAVTGAAPASNYVAVNPDRILDTRNGIGVTGHAALGQGGVVKVQVAGANGVPTNANAVTLNVTEASNSKGGYLTAYPDGTDRGLPSSVNFQPTTGALANEITVKLGVDGAVDIYNLAGVTDVVADLEGYFAPPAATTFGIGQVLVHTSLTSPTPSVWAQYEVSELGAPGGDQAGGTFRFTCKNATDGCDVSLQAYSTGDGWTVYPRIVMQKESNVDGSESTCEYADGVNNEVSPETGFSAVLPTAPTALTLGIGSTADCGGSQTGTQPDGVASINVPGATGQGDHYDAAVTLSFVRTTA
jgi:hypothetical protein